METAFFVDRRRRLPSSGPSTRPVDQRVVACSAPDRDADQENTTY
jgi:hypothetical protein